MSFRAILYGVEVIFDTPSSSISLPRFAEYDRSISLSMGTVCMDGVDETVKESEMRGVHGRDVRIRVFGKDTRRWLYEVSDVALFGWKEGERRVYVQIQDEKYLFWFVHQVLPFYLHMEGIRFFFHAGAVFDGEGAMLFCAPSMGGKSTLTDRFVAGGFSYISDDKCAIVDRDDEILCARSHYFRRPYRRFETLGEYTEGSVDSFVSLSALYVMHKVEEMEEIGIDRLYGAEKIFSLTPHILYGGFDKASAMKFLARISSKVPVYRVSLPWSMERLDEVVSAISHYGSGV